MKLVRKLIGYFILAFVFAVIISCMVASVGAKVFFGTILAVLSLVGLVIFAINLVID